MLRKCAYFFANVSKFVLHLCLNVVPSCYTCRKFCVLENVVVF